MKLDVQFIDAFTDTPFKGNPAAVILLTHWLSDELMQSIATENNVSETAFVLKNIDGYYHIRWFSPITEIDFCGHATLATAFVLFNQRINQETLTFFADAVGHMTVKKMASGEIQMSFPNRKPNKVNDIPSDLLQGLSIRPEEVYVNEQAYFVVYNNECDVMMVTQDKEYLTKLAPLDVVVTAKSKQYDFISRYFWPANGGDEDPVTGSIHAGLAPLWVDKLHQEGQDKSILHAYQASKRGGYLTCQIVNDRVLVSGKAVQYLTGVIHI